MDLKNQDPNICCLQETHFISKDTHRLKVKECKMILQVDEIQEKADVAIFISDKLQAKRGNKRKRR